MDTQASLEEMAKMERRVQWETRVRKATVAFQDSLVLTDLTALLVLLEGLVTVVPKAKREILANQE